jgi:hypothetical protein
MAGHVAVSGVIKSSGREIQKGAWWAQVEVGSTDSMLLFSGAFKTYANLWEGKNLVIPTQ